MVFDDLERRGIAQGVHVAVMQRQYQILQLLICFKINDRQSCLFAPVNLKMGIVLLRIVEVRKNFADGLDLLFLFVRRKPSKHVFLQGLSDKPVASTAHSHLYRNDGVIF